MNIPDNHMTAEQIAKKYKRTAGAVYAAAKKGAFKTVREGVFTFYPSDEVAAHYSSKRPYNKKTTTKGIVSVDLNTPLSGPSIQIPPAKVGMAMVVFAPLNEVSKLLTSFQG
jgi:hypothetical protein